MKTKQEIKEKEFDTVKTFRVIIPKISKDIFGMTLPQNSSLFKATKIETLKNSMLS